MAKATTGYVIRTKDGGYRLRGSRVTLDSIVHGYWEGQSPEAIADDFPTLALEQVYGAIAFYLRNRAEVDAYMKEQAKLWQRLKAESRTQNGTLVRRVRARARRNPRRARPS